MYSEVFIKEKIKGLYGSDEFVWNYDSSEWTDYSCFWRQVFSLSNILNLKNRKEILVIAENSLLLFELYFSCMISNTTIIPIDPQKSKNEIDLIIAEHKDALVLREDDIRRVFTQKTESITRNQLESIIDNVDFQKPYLITYTSGSTDNPKGVIHNLYSLFLAALSFGETVGLSSDFTMCHVMPMTYMAGILNTILLPFVMGCKVAILHRFDVISAVSFWNTVCACGADAFWLSPSMLNIITTVDRKGRGKEYLDTKNPLFFIGTAPLFQGTRSRFEELYGVKLLQSYGLSETLFLSTEKPHCSDEPSSVGEILPEVKCVIEEDGELIVSVPWMFMTYSNMNTEEYFDGIYYHTGDIGEVCNKVLYIRGRKKDLIVKGGMNICPKDIEDSIMDCPEIKDCAVSGMRINDEEQIVCWYEVSKGCKIDEKEINRKIEKNVGNKARVDQFRLVDIIPKNLNGKTDKQKLRDGFLL